MSQPEGGATAEFALTPEVVPSISGPGTCGEMNLSSLPSDLRSARAADAALDQRCFKIQKMAVVQAGEQLKKEMSSEVLERINNSKVLVTGASGYLGASILALVKSLDCNKVAGLDVAPPCEKTLALLDGAKVTLGSASDPTALTAATMSAFGSEGADIVFHAAAWHAPHASHQTEEEFRESNVASVKPVLGLRGVRSVVATSTTSHTITEAVKAREKRGECVWLTEMAGGERDHPPRNKYGRTKREAERLFVVAAAAATASLPAVVILRTSRFFPEDAIESSSLSMPNLMANELLGRRAALSDLLTAHILAASRANDLTGRILTISAIWPRALKGGDNVGTAIEVAEDVKANFGPDAYKDAPGWSLPDKITRVYDAEAAVKALGWRPVFNFENILERLKEGDPVALLGLY